jgi:hypothetical protein
MADYRAANTVLRPTFADNDEQRRTLGMRFLNRRSQVQILPGAQAQAALTELLSAHQTGTFVAPDRTTLGEFFEPWLDGLTNQGRSPRRCRAIEG